MRDASSDHPRLAEAVRALQQLLDARRLEPPADLLALAERVTGYTAVLANLPGSERREADWRGLRELVRDLARGSEDAFAVVRWLRQLLKAGTEVPRPPLEAGDAVTLTTVHGSKGLEWPVVVLPDLVRRGSETGRKVPSYTLCHRRHRYHHLLEAPLFLLTGHTQSIALCV